MCLVNTDIATEICKTGKAKRAWPGGRSLTWRESMSSSWKRRRKLETRQASTVAQVLATMSGKRRAGCKYCTIYFGMVVAAANKMSKKTTSKPSR